MRPTTKTMATQATMSAWFWMTNSWLRMGGFLLAPRRFTTIVISQSCFSLAEGGRVVVVQSFAGVDVNFTRHSKERTHAHTDRRVRARVSAADACTGG